MRRALFCLWLTACGSEAIEKTIPCTGLKISVLDEAIAPPANVAALVRVGECDGAPIGRRLDEHAFTLSEDGVVLSEHEATRAIIPATRESEARTVLALDLSGSIVRSGLRTAMIDGARELIGALDPAHAVAIFGFDGRPDLVPFAFFTTDRLELSAALDRALESPLVDDSTNLNGAILNALSVLDRAVEVEERGYERVAHGALVVFTDGRDLARRVDPDDVDDALDNTDHSTFAIGVGGDIDATALAQIGRDHTAVAGNAAEIAAAFSEVAAKLTARAESDYVVSYCSPARAGDRILEISVTDGDRRAALELEFSADGFGAGCSPHATPLR